MYNRIVWSVWKESAEMIDLGCFNSSGRIPGREVDWQTVWDTFAFRSETVCFSKPVQRTFLGLLIGLQIITLAWLYMILRVAWRVVRGANADDTRSEDEDEDEDDDQEQAELPTVKSLSPASRK